VTLFLSAEENEKGSKDSQSCINSSSNRNKKNEGRRQSGLFV
jgi:hypothetical protein